MDCRYSGMRPTTRTHCKSQTSLITVKSLSQVNKRGFRLIKEKGSRVSKTIFYHPEKPLPTFFLMFKNRYIVLGKRSPRPERK